MGLSFLERCLHNLSIVIHSPWGHPGYIFIYIRYSRTCTQWYTCNCIHLVFSNIEDHIYLYIHNFGTSWNFSRLPAVFRRIWMHTLQCRRSCRAGGNNCSKVVLIGLWPKPWQLDLWFYALIPIAMRLDFLDWKHGGMLMLRNVRELFFEARMRLRLVMVLFSNVNSYYSSITSWDGWP